MAEKRMFSKTITESDAFLDLPLSTQALYFHLCIHADDDGFLGGYRKIMRMIGSTQNEYDLLIAKSFLIEFADGVVVIKHWLMHNYIRKDRYKPTVYLKEKEMLFLKENRAYTLDETQGLPLGIPKVDADKNRLVKSSINKDSIDKFSELMMFYQQNIEQLPTNIVLEGLTSWYDHFGYELVKEAILITAKANVRKYNYMDKILKNWLNDGVKTIDDLSKEKLEEEESLIAGLDLTGLCDD